MSSLKGRVVRLAAEDPELRKDLLSVLASQRIRSDQELRKALQSLRAVTSPKVKKYLATVLDSVEKSLDIARNPEVWGAGADSQESMYAYAEDLEYLVEDLEKQQRKQNSLSREVLLYAIEALGSAAYQFPDWKAENELEVAWQLLKILGKKIR